MTPAPRDPLIRWPMCLTTLVAAGSGAAFWALHGPGPLRSVVAGWLVVVLSFGVTSRLRSWAADRSPLSVMAAAMVLYSTKVLVLGGVLLLLWNATWLDGTAFAVSTIGCVLAWMVGLVVAAQRSRTPVYDAAPPLP